MVLHKAEDLCTEAHFIRFHVLVDHIEKAFQFPTVHVCLWGLLRI